MKIVYEPSYKKMERRWGIPSESKSLWTCVVCGRNNYFVLAELPVVDGTRILTCKCGTWLEGVFTYAYPHATYFCPLSGQYPHFRRLIGWN